LILKKSTRNLFAICRICFVSFLHFYIKSKRLQNALKNQTGSSIQFATHLQGRSMHLIVNLFIVHDARDILHPITSHIRIFIENMILGIVLI